MSYSSPSSLNFQLLISFFPFLWANNKHGCSRHHLVRSGWVFRDMPGHKTGFSISRKGMLPARLTGSLGYDTETRNQVFFICADVWWDTYSAWWTALTDKTKCHRESCRWLTASAAPSTWWSSPSWLQLLWSMMSSCPSDITEMFVYTRTDEFMLS